VHARIARVNGVGIAYYVRGEGPPVLFIMGLGGRASDWNEDFLRALGTRFELITVDNRGTGASEAPSGAFTLDAMADEVVGILDALGRPTAHVVGVSMGGMIAQLVALRHSTRVDRLVLIATHPGGPSVVPPTPAALAVLVADRSRPAADLVRDAVSTITAPGFAARAPAVIDALVALAEAQPTPPSVFARQLAAILASDRTARLADITRPTLVVHGTEDPLVPLANGAALARTVPDARLVELEECGHLPMWECPDRLAAIVREFLAAPG
jgi:pimeloyl-ACP methyl ester carboxylesterase